MQRSPVGENTKPRVPKIGRGRVGVILPYCLCGTRCNIRWVVGISLQRIILIRITMYTFVELFKWSCIKDVSLTVGVPCDIWPIEVECKFLDSNPLVGFHVILNSHFHFFNTRPINDKLRLQRFNIIDNVSF